MSMSMSMNYGTDPTKAGPPNGSSVPVAPSAAPSTYVGEPTLSPSSYYNSTSYHDELNICVNLSSTRFDIRIEVDTAIGVTDFTNELAYELMNALSSDYSFCKYGKTNETRTSEDSKLLGNLTIAKDNNGRSPAC